MKFEDQVVSLPLAKRLKEMGVRQDSLFHWRKHEGDWDIWRLGEPTPLALQQHIISAFTVAELGEMLFSVVGCVLPWPGMGGWYFDRPKGEFEISKTEADARARLLIRMIETGSLDASKIK